LWLHQLRAEDVIYNLVKKGGKSVNADSQIAKVAGRTVQQLLALCTVQPVAAAVAA